MNAGTLIRDARHRSALSLRDLGRAAGTSHSAIAAYESGRKEPSFETLTRILRAAGYEMHADVRPAMGGADAAARGRELVEVLELAALFPARHDRYLQAPVFGRP